MKVFGERVKATLKENGRTQKALAAAINVQPSTLCEWLNGNNQPPMQAIVDIAVYLDVSTDYLLGLKEYD
ncbi:MAG: helix-turn-helix transcriptional regulator [Clostridia bacterium]|nr:helix-turn-helix transcriptional regulator [Clostridia bacterium]